MSPTGQPHPAPATATAIVVASSTLPRGHWFPEHSHPVHQLVWSRTGVLSVRTDAGTWLLPPTMALWVPAGVPHSTGTTSGAVMRSPYVAPRECPVSWSEPTVVAVTPLLRDLVDHLALPSLPAPARGRAEAVLFDLLAPLAVRTVSLPEPADPRALLVAERLTADPTDNRTLDEWGTVAGTSGRTLARLFTAETGMSFGHWREQLRMRASMPLLAEGRTVESVARRVGYASASSFVAAFHRTLGLTPRQYFP